MSYQSKAQSRYVHGVASGSIPPKKGGMTRKAAQTFAKHSKGQSTAKLPERKSSK